MKDIVTKILEGSEWNPSLNSHKKCYNDLIKWYDKCLRYMEKDEIVDLLRTALDDIGEDQFNELK